MWKRKRAKRSGTGKQWEKREGNASCPETWQESRKLERLIFNGQYTVIAQHRPSSENRRTIFEASKQLTTLRLPSPSDVPVVETSTNGEVTTTFASDTVEQFKE
ncbi:hypothetical protein L2E82_31581 [Cichorium intybus]|uniref:Uncharacterized protein n=1 Tax=Cichorium intybus TaxID=13427 RepID=A0ACB9BDM4_CICIN|nr:hypothetical protein L2E82_31581 [Cichorium intybus]